MAMPYSIQLVGAALLLVAATHAQSVSNEQLEQAKAGRDQICSMKGSSSVECQQATAAVNMLEGMLGNGPAVAPGGVTRSPANNYATAGSAGEKKTS